MVRAIVRPEGSPEGRSKTIRMGVESVKHIGLKPAVKERVNYG